MWTQRTSWFTAAFIVAVLLAGRAPAQGQRATSPLNAAANGDPFNDPFGVTPSGLGSDLEFFAPVDIDSYGHNNAPRLGWSTNFAWTKLWLPQPDKVLIYENRTNDQGNAIVTNRLLTNLGGGDIAGGWRADFDYFGDTGGGTAAGWIFNYTQIGGSPLHEVIAVSRVGRFNSGDDNHGNNENGGANAGSPPVFPLHDRNNWETGAMDYWVAPGGLNEVGIHGIELNRAFRLAPLHYGARIEPFFGCRYMQLRDYTQRDAYQRQDANGAPLPFPSDPNAQIDILLSDMTTWQNRMVLGQLGVRLSQPIGSVAWSTEFRAFVGPNFQDYQLRRESLETFYPGAGNDNLPTTERTELQYDYNSYTELVIGTEIRAQAAWYVTRDISLTVGAEVLGFGRGLGRSNIFNDNDQAMWSAGGTFGFQVRR